MAMKRCTVCGEKYSDTYRKCPFCEEDALREDEEIRRMPSRSRRSTRSRQYNLITPTLIILIIIMASLLVYLLYGDKIAQKLGGQEDGEKNTPPVAGVSPQQPEVNTPPTIDPDDEGTDPSGEGNRPGEIPDTPDTQTSGNGTQSGNSTQSGTSGNSGTESSEMTYEKAMALPSSGLSLNKSDFTRPVSEGAYQLKETSGSSSKLTWISEDPGVASVDATGKVTPIAAGMTNIVVTDGSRKAVCIVRVRGGSSTSSPQTTAPNTGSTGSTGTNTLNREDMTISVGETFRLQLSGVTTALSWSVADSSIATVGGDGTVTGVSKGMTTVTVSWDGQSKNCIVRVK